MIWMYQTHTPRLIEGMIPVMTAPTRPRDTEDPR